MHASRWSSDYACHVGVIVIDYLFGDEWNGGCLLRDPCLVGVLGDGSGSDHADFQVGWSGSAELGAAVWPGVMSAVVAMRKVQHFRKWINIYSVSTGYGFDFKYRSGYREVMR